MTRAMLFPLFTCSTSSRMAVDGYLFAICKAKLQRLQYFEQNIKISSLVILPSEVIKVDAI
jgi:hypothetical protein